MMEFSSVDEVFEVLGRGGFDPKTSSNGVFADAAAFNKKVKVLFLGIGSVEGPGTKTFSEALAATPPKPLTFVLYFLSDTTALTPASRAQLPKILSEAKHRREPDVDVIGHTDRAATDTYNQRLGLERAKKIRAELIAIGIDESRIRATSHGEHDPLVQTRDGVPEQRNRRVEVTVR